MVRCGLWRMITHILACARIHITDTVRQLLITRFGGRPASLDTQHVLMKVPDVRFSISLRFSVYVPSDI